MHFLPNPPPPRQLLATHRSPIRQSTSALQATQRRLSRSHTSPAGHSGEVVQLAGTTQLRLMQALSRSQSAALRHSTQLPLLASHNLRPSAREAQSALAEQRCGGAMQTPASTSQGTGSRSFAASEAPAFEPPASEPASNPVPPTKGLAP